MRKVIIIRGPLFQKDGPLRLEKARKDVVFDWWSLLAIEPLLSESGEEYSEWAVAATLLHFESWTEVPIEEFQEKLDEMALQQAIDHLVELGLVKMEWNEEYGEPVYFAT